MQPRPQSPTYIIVFMLHTDGSQSVNNGLDRVGL